MLKLRAVSGVTSIESEPEYGLQEAFGFVKAHLLHHDVSLALQLGH